MFVILTLGLIGNFLTLVVLFHPQHRTKSMTPLMVNLCVADLLVCLFGYTVAVNYNTADFANTGSAPALCYWLAFINAATGLASIGTLAVMAIITYLGISRNEIAQQNRMTGKAEMLLLTGKRSLFVLRLRKKKTQRKLLSNITLTFYSWKKRSSWFNCQNVFITEQLLCYPKGIISVVWFLTLHLVSPQHFDHYDEGNRCW